MYSGSDSMESANYNQWPLNPTYFQNMPNEQVDWAALAQQWIQMKEAGPPIPEPRPIETRKESNGNDKDMIGPSNNSEGKNSTWNNLPNTCESFDATWNWKAQPNWDWNNTWNSQLSNSMATPTSKTTLLPTPKSCSSIDTSNENASLNAGYSTSRSSEFNSGFSGPPLNQTHHYKPHNRRYSKVNVPKVVSVPQTPLVNMPSTSDIETSSLDANKRKQLPAWIREGLEKMERDKQRQIDREREKEKQNIYTEKIKEQEKKTMEILKDTIRERRRSKFDSDDEQSPKRSEQPLQESKPLSHDELMLLVRRTMTEILLKVTNEAILSICTEERQRYVKKFQTSMRDYGKTLASEKLGLGMYDSDSGSETDDSDVPQKNSDDELKSSIRKRKADFVQTEKCIEDKLLVAEQKKNTSKTTHDDEDSVENQKDDGYSESKRDEDTNLKNKSNTRKHQASPQTSDESDRASSRKKSSSRSRESSVTQKRRRRSRSRGYTPEKRKRHKSPKRSRSRSYDRRHSHDYRNKKEKARLRKSRSRSRTFRRSRSRSSSFRSRRSSEASSRSKRKRSRSRNYYRNSRRSRSRSHNKSSRTR